MQLIYTALLLPVFFASINSSGICHQLDRKYAAKKQANVNIQQLDNKNFTNGPVFLTKPGYYKLTENVDFNPNKVTKFQDAYLSSDVDWNKKGANETYDLSAFSRGFFAGIIITGSDILLDLGNFTIQQSQEHALQQRSFSNIELSNRPHDFVGLIESSNRICIRNGTLGRSSHSAIHGSGNVDVELQHLVIRDFEAAGIAFNNVSNLDVVNVAITNGRQDVPVVGAWQAARNIRPYVNKMVEGRYTGYLELGTKRLYPQDIYFELQKLVNQVYDLVVNSNLKEEFKSPQSRQVGMFLNPSFLPDSNLRGMDVNGQQVNIQNVTIGELNATTSEIPALVNSAGEAVRDASGSIFQSVNKDYFQTRVTTNSNGHYIGNALSSAQLLVAKAILDQFDFGDLSTTENTIDENVISWAERGSSEARPTYRCNSNSINDPLSGVVGVRIDSSNDVIVKKLTIHVLENKGMLGSTLCSDNEDYQLSKGKSNPDATYPGYSGATTKGFSVEGSSQVNLKDCYVNQTLSYSGSSIGYDVHRGSYKVNMTNCFSERVAAATQQPLKAYKDNPTPIPVAFGFRVFSGAVDVYGSQLQLGKQALSSGKNDESIAAELSDPECAFNGSTYQLVTLTSFVQKIDIDEDAGFGEKDMPVIDCPTRRTPKRLTFGEDTIAILFISLGGVIVVGMGAYFIRKNYRRRAKQSYKQLVEDVTNQSILSTVQEETQQQIRQQKSQ